MISMIDLGDIVITELMDAELYKNLDTDKNVLYFEGMAEVNDSDEKQKRILGRIPDFGTRCHVSVSDLIPEQDKCTLPIKKEYEKSIGIHYDNEAPLYTLSQLSSYTLKIDEIDNKEQLDNVPIIKTKYNIVGRDS